MNEREGGRRDGAAFQRQRQRSRVSAAAAETLFRSGCFYLGQDQFRSNLLRVL
ncbi:hypothetical protein Hanom_Chr09g00852521 [Helianthus anomalus]